MAPMDERERRSFRVEGMSCEHCVAAVSSEISAIAGVSAVEVDLASGRVLVSGAGVQAEQVREAVEEAGYTLAG